eukprot:3590148-Pyramimonas_sp.AAC.1
MALLQSSTFPPPVFPPSFYSPPPSLFSSLPVLPSAVPPPPPPSSSILPSSVLGCCNNGVALEFHGLLHMLADGLASFRARGFASLLASLHVRSVAIITGPSSVVS